MCIHQDISRLSPPDGIFKESGLKPAFNTLSDREKLDSTPDSHYREVPVHVTKQADRSVDAEAPPSNRRPAITPPPRGNEGDKQPDGDDQGQPSGNEGGGGGGDRGPLSVTQQSLRTINVFNKTFCVSRILYVRRVYV
jgi:hypothetical protein